jgi:hypothetical protein
MPNRQVCSNSPVVVENPSLDDFKYKIGDKVHYVNDYGVYWGVRTIIGIEMWIYGPRYYLSNSDTPWFPVSETNLFDKKPADGVIQCYARAWIEIDDLIEA